MATHENHCCICGRSILAQDETCGRSDCVEHLKEIRDYFAEEYRTDRNDGLIAALKQRCKHDDEWSLNILQRWFYILKLLVCVLFRLRYKGDKTFPDRVEVGVFANCGYGWEDNWKSITVGHGCFSGWWWGLESN